jgi:hypothetical protein
VYERHELLIYFREDTVPHAVVWPRVDDTLYRGPHARRTTAGHMRGEWLALLEEVERAHPMLQAAPTFRACPPPRAQPAQLPPLLTLLQCSFGEDCRAPQLEGFEIALFVQARADSKAALIEDRHAASVA